MPAGLTTDWPVKFDVRTCRPVKFRISAISGSFEVPAGQADVVVDHDDAHDPARANVFVEFQATGAANVTQSGSVDIDAFIDDDEDTSPERWAPNTRWAAFTASACRRGWYRRARARWR